MSMVPSLVFFPSCATNQLILLFYFIFCRSTRCQFVELLSVLGHLVCWKPFLPNHSPWFYVNYIFSFRFLRLFKFFFRSLFNCRWQPCSIINHVIRCDNIIFFTIFYFPFIFSVFYFFTKRGVKHNGIPRIVIHYIKRGNKSCCFPFRVF